MALMVIAGTALAAEKADRYPLKSADYLTLHNVAAEPARHQGKSGLRVTLAEDIQERFGRMEVQARQRAAVAGQFPQQLALIDGLEFGDGTLEVELAGEADTRLFENARGFVGIAFHVQQDRRTYDAFYLRPTNGRADDQVRRNHSVQYISHPEGTWSRLREESPGKYESYVDLVPGQWTRVRIEVAGSRALLYVHDAVQPTLIVNDLKTGPGKRGGVALWLDAGTVAHFRNLRVTHAVAAAN
jgi:hypothetical protein